MLCSSRSSATDPELIRLLKQRGLLSLGSNRLLLKQLLAGTQANWQSWHGINATNNAL
jgi:hypothetical protein